jgi:hypothetical protein
MLTDEFISNFRQMMRSGRPLPSPRDPLGAYDAQPVRDRLDSADPDAGGMDEEDDNDSAAFLAGCCKFLQHMRSKLDDETFAQFVDGISRGEGDPAADKFPTYKADGMPNNNIDRAMDEALSLGIGRITNEGGRSVVPKPAATAVPGRIKQGA